MQFDNSIKIIIDKRKLDTLLRLNCPQDNLINKIFYDKYIPTNDPLLDDYLETLTTVKEFNNWGGSRNGSGRKSNKINILNQVDIQDENQDERQLEDKDRDKDNIYIEKENIKEKENSIQDLDVIQLAFDGYNKKYGKEITNVFKDYLEYKNKLGKPLKFVSYNFAIENLNDLCNGDSYIARKIVEQSIANGWLNLKPLTEENRALAEKNKTKTKYHDENLTQYLLSKE